MEPWESAPTEKSAPGNAVNLTKEREKPLQIPIISTIFFPFKKQQRQKTNRKTKSTTTNRKKKKNGKRTSLRGFSLRRCPLHRYAFTMWRSFLFKWTVNLRGPAGQHGRFMIPKSGFELTHKHLTSSLVSLTDERFSEHQNSVAQTWSWRDAVAVNGCYFIR